MDLKLIQRLIQVMKKGGLFELELEDQKEGLRVRLKRGGEGPAAGPLVHLMHPPGAAHPAAAPAGSGAGLSPAAGAGGGAAAGAPGAERGHTITSPMVGTFYRSPSPESEPFVSVGTHLAVDAPLCIIEAMKVMNEIKCEVAGEVLEV